jgi:hypothetical protein
MQQHPALTGQRMRSERFTTRRSWSWPSKRYDHSCGHWLWQYERSWLIQSQGNTPQTIPLALSCTDVHAHEHQDWRLQRGLLLLRTELEI